MTIKLYTIKLNADKRNEGEPKIYMRVLGKSFFKKNRIIRTVKLWDENIKKYWKERVQLVLEAEADETLIYSIR
jgi:hypothetical protein